MDDVGGGGGGGGGGCSERAVDGGGGRGAGRVRGGERRGAVERAGAGGGAEAHGEELPPPVAQLPPPRRAPRRLHPAGADDHPRAPLPVGEPLVQDRAAHAGEDGQRDQELLADQVQKHAKQLGCDVNSRQFKDVMRHLWMPRLVERIHAAAASSERAAPPPCAAAPASHSGMCHSPDPSTTTSSTAGSSVTHGEQFPSSTNHHLMTMASVTTAAADWSSEKCGSGSATSTSVGISYDMFEGSWSELLARAYDDDGADSSLLPDFQMADTGDNCWWSNLEDIWSQQPY
ncbi:hypothetical protein OsI_01519 [Oryza sativa Indica Group]|uniref:Uncharacterized protein n=1 Tax=Oryza sativa subsp. indica TaxID=39946 RepID=A2WNT6_ORYSI|nr:hypothetical protein OsI_01519 [Oryza sativa Indica Group]